MITHIVIICVDAIMLQFQLLAVSTPRDIEFNMNCTKNRYIKGFQKLIYIKTFNTKDEYKRAKHTQVSNQKQLVIDENILMRN
jgi:hypothetical protein